MLLAFISLCVVVSVAFIYGVFMVIMEAAICERIGK